MRIEKESDTLKREYKSLVRMLERITKNSKVSLEYRQLQMDQIFERQKQIVKELEECTGIQITCTTVEDTIKENIRIQFGDSGEGILG